MGLIVNTNNMPKDSVRIAINEKWRKNLFIICVILAAIGTAAEILIYMVDRNLRVLFLPEPMYRFRFIYLPSSINLLTIILTYFFLHKAKLSDTAKNIWSCVLIFVLCANTQITHYVYGPLLMLPVIAIFFSVIFGNRRLTRAITVASYLSLAIAAYLSSIELRKNDTQLVSDIFLAGLVIFVAHLGASLMDAYIIEQYHSIAAGNTRQSQLIEELHIDSLMGIYNRMALNERIHDCENEHKEQGADYTMLLFDIDDFKKINDSYGHLKGDEVLVELADIIRNCENINLSAYRYGGEEIVLIFRNSDAQRAYEIGERIRMDFSRKRFDGIEDLSITISGGIAEISDTSSGEEWIQAADEAMYLAKKKGKNRIVISDRA